MPCRTVTRPAQATGTCKSVSGSPPTAEREWIEARIPSTAEPETGSPETVGRIYESKRQFEREFERSFQRSFQRCKVTDDTSGRDRLRVLGSERGSEPFWRGPHVRRNALRYESQRAGTRQKELSQSRGDDRPRGNTQIDQDRRCRDRHPGMDALQARQGRPGKRQACLR